MSPPLRDNDDPAENLRLYGTHWPKVIVCRRPHYEVAYERFGEQGEHTFVHLDLKARWSPGLKRRFQVDVGRLAALHGGPFLVLSTPLDKKHHKFCAQFGFAPKLYLPAAGNGEDKLILYRPAESKKKKNGKHFQRSEPKDPDHNQHEPVAQCGDGAVLDGGSEWRVKRPQ